MGYNISISDGSDIDYRGRIRGIGFLIRVVLYTDKPLEINDEVKDEFERMFYYLKSVGIDNISVNYVKGNSILKSSYDKFMNDVKETPGFFVRDLLFIARV